MIHTRLTLALGLLLTLHALSPCSAEDWPQFRGPEGNGISRETDVPLSWSQKSNIRWRVELPGPGNNGSPIVAKDAVFLAVATEDGHRRALHCYDRNTGQERWIRTVEFPAKVTTHKTNLYAGSTPVADADRVVVWHSSAGMHCYDYDGNQLWSKDLGKFIHIWGYGASPIIHNGLVINNCGPGDRTFLVGLDKKTGQQVWRTDEPGGKSGPEKPWIGSWSTPVVASVGGRDQILVGLPNHVKAYDPSDGKVLWQCGGLGNLFYTDVAIGKNLAVAMGGFHGPAVGFKLGGSGDVTQENQVWRVERNPQRIGSGVILGDRMFMVNETGVAECLDVVDGEQQWEARLPVKGRTWSSLVLAAGRIYATTQTGETVVFAADPEKFEVLATNSIGEHTNSTLAVSGKQVFLRTYKALYCIEDQ